MDPDDYQKKANELRMKEDELTIREEEFHFKKLKLELRKEWQELRQNNSDNPRKRQRTESLNPDSDTPEPVTKRTSAMVESESTDSHIRFIVRTLSPCTYHLLIP